jgi:hypothetical protein
MTKIVNTVKWTASKLDSVSNIPYIIEGCIKDGTHTKTQRARAIGSILYDIDGGRTGFYTRQSLINYMTKAASPVKEHAFGRNKSGEFLIGLKLQNPLMTEGEFIAAVEPLTQYHWATKEENQLLKPLQNDKTIPWGVLPDWKVTYEAASIEYFHIPDDGRSMSQKRMGEQIEKLGINLY